MQKQSEILEKVFERQQIPYEVSVRKTVRDIPVLDWLIRVLRFSVNPADGQVGMDVLADPQYGEKCTRAKAKKIIQEQKRDSVLLYRRMMEFQEQEEWKKSETVPGAAEVFAYFGLKEALHPTASSYYEDEKLVLKLLEKKDMTKKIKIQFKIIFFVLILLSVSAAIFSVSYARWVDKSGRQIKISGTVGAWKYG